jgi:hypothetical protein
LAPVDQAARMAYRAALRHRWLSEAWTRKECVIPECGNSVFQLHHASYDQSRPTELLGLVPLCGEHHLTFEHEIWPAVKDMGLSRWLVTLCFVVHGEALLEYLEWAAPVAPTDAHIDQLALWEVGP